MGLIPFFIGVGIFTAFNYQPYIPCIQCTILCLSALCILLCDNINFNSSFILYKSGSKYYNIETLDENDNNKEFARDSLFIKNEIKEEENNKFSLNALGGKVYILGTISIIILIICSLCAFANKQLEINFATMLSIPAFDMIVNDLFISSYNSYLLPYSIIIFYILAAILGILEIINPYVQYGFVYCVVLLFTQIILLILSKINLNKKICGLGLVGVLSCLAGACANCLNNIMGNNIMYMIFFGAVISIIACYYKIKSIDEIEKKKKENNNDIELQDIEKE